MLLSLVFSHEAKVQWAAFFWGVSFQLMGLIAEQTCKTPVILDPVSKVNDWALLVEVTR